jgi:hypothetical protein
LEILVSYNLPQALLLFFVSASLSHEDLSLRHKRFLRLLGYILQKKLVLPALIIIISFSFMHNTFRYSALRFG